MAKTGQISTIARPPRPGEGTVVELARKQISHPDGSSGVELAIDLSIAPVPERRYVADVAALTYDEGMVQFLFGQKKIGKSGALRSLIVLQMTSLAVGQFAKTLIAVEPGLRKWIEQNGNHGELANIEEEPDQTVTLFANMVGLAFAGPEACVDFYHASAFSIHFAQQNKKMAVDPVVRVILNSGLMIRMIDKLHALEPNFPKGQGLTDE
jgi:hypothetical protein